jgi:hypothetical protein
MFLLPLCFLPCRFNLPREQNEVYGKLLVELLSELLSELQNKR